MAAGELAEGAAGKRGWAPCWTAASEARLAERTVGRLEAAGGRPSKAGGTQRRDGVARTAAAALRRKAATCDGGGEPNRARAAAAGGRPSSGGGGVNATGLAAAAATAPATSGSETSQSRPSTENRQPKASADEEKVPAGATRAQHAGRKSEMARASQSAVRGVATATTAVWSSASSDAQRSKRERKRRLGSAPQPKGARRERTPSAEQAARLASEFTTAKMAGTPAAWHAGTTSAGGPNTIAPDKVAGA